MTKIETIERYGFAIIPNVLDDGTCNELIAILNEVGPTTGTLERSGVVYAMRDLLRRIPEAVALASRPSVRAIVERILGPEARVVRGLMLDKRLEANWGVPWHQDLTIAVAERSDCPGFRAWTLKAGIPHVQPPMGFLSQMLTLRIHLDDDSPTNGPLRVIPGSHRSGRLDVEASRRELERGTPVPCLIPRGAPLAMRTFLLRSSSAAEYPVIVGCYTWNSRQSVCPNL